MRINITKGYFLSFLLAGIAIILLILGTKIRFDLAKNNKLEDLTLEDCQDCRYVTGTIREYAGCYINQRKQTFSGAGIYYIDGLLGAEYEVYTVKLKDGSYISVYIKDEDTLNCLNSYVNGIGKDAFIEGKITKLPTELNYEWLKSALGKSTKEEIEKLVSPVYAIIETDFSKEKKILDWGLLCLFLSAVLFLHCGGIRNLLQKNTM